VVVFQVLSKMGKVVSLDEDRWRHILEHPEMKNQLDRIKETAANPDEVRASIHDSSVLLFYKLYEETPVITLVLPAKFDLAYLSTETI
jgi:hypothetical protein